MPSNPPPRPRRPSTTSTQVPASDRPRRAPGALPSSKAAAGEAPKLVVTAGPAAGAEFVLEAAEMTCGRNADNPIAVADTSVSRKHFSVSSEGATWTITDLGSGNGTFLNGEKIEGPTVLNNGDVIVTGDTEFNYVDGAGAALAAAAPARPALRSSSGGEIPSRRGTSPTVRPRTSRQVAAAGPDPMAAAKKKKLLMIGAGALGVLMLAVIGMSIAGKSAREKAELEARARAEMQQKLREINAEGRSLVREGKWLEAKAKFEEIVEVAPQYPGVADYLERSKKEIPNQQNLAKAAKALAENDLSTAAEALSQVSADTQQYDQLANVKRAFDERVPAKLLEARANLESAVALGKRDRPAGAAKADEARRMIADILKADPNNYDANSISKMADDLYASLTRVIEPKKARVPEAWEAPLDRYVDGDLTGALAMISECAGRGNSKCRKFKKDMTAFSELYRKVESLDGNGLTKLMNLDTAIAGDRSPSKMAKVAGTRAANIFYKQASSAQATGEWARALSQAKMALKSDPNHAAARKLVEMAKGKALDVYMQGYTAKDNDPETAMKHFRDFLLMVGPDHEKYQTAKNWLNRLQNQ